MFQRSSDKRMPHNKIVLESGNFIEVSLFGRPLFPSILNKELAIILLDKQKWIDGFDFKSVIPKDEDSLE